LSNRERDMNSGFPIVTLMFDDGFSSVYDEAFPLLEKFGYRANIALPASKINKNGYLTYDQVRELLDHGWALSDHSYSHINMSRTNANCIEADVRKNRNIVKKLFNFDLMDFAFPKSKLSPESLRTILMFYPIVYTGTSKISGNVFPFHTRLLKRTEFSIYEVIIHGLTFRSFLTCLNEHLKTLVGRREWLILFTHRITRTPGMFDMHKYIFWWLVQTIHNFEIPVVTTDQVIKSLKRQALPSNI
jgi:peptidoglycan/xylan/chitin deacetylase (PgdA/CDA1 family)